MEQDLNLQNEEDYISSQDEDFDPTAPAVNAQEDESSASEDEPDSVSVKSVSAKKVERTVSKNDAEDLGFENSGDEATIKKGRKRKRKDRQNSDHDSGGEGGFVKTRSMRAVEDTIKKPLASADGATIDVDALWKSMNIDDTPTVSPASHENTLRKSGVTQVVLNGKPVSPKTRAPSNNIISDSSRSEDMITIESPYVFAGVTSIRKKLVPKNSPEALAYNEALHERPLVTSTHAPLRRPLKRPSRFEPNPLGIVKGIPASANKGPKLKVVDKSKLDWQDHASNTQGLNKGLLFAATTSSTNSSKAPKLNVVEKSKLDWAGYVDQEGIQDELKNAEKAKEGYMSRTEFLGRVEANREDELRIARLK